MKKREGITISPFLLRLRHWEFWSFGAVYGWVIPYWLWLSIRCRSFFFFSASNPTIENGGLLNESKKDIHAILPIGLYPRTLHFEVSTPGDIVIEAIRRAGLHYPLMAKPDIGGKGRGVRKLSSVEDLQAYVTGAVMDYHVQEYIAFEKEAGIFYYRMPGAKNGKVTGIVRKEFLAVTGDGRQTVEALLQADPRGKRYVDQFRNSSLSAALESIPSDGEKRIISPFGNHARGALFIDDSHLIDATTEAQLDKIADQIPGFHFGRLDIRFRDWESFKRGEDFMLIEVNGAGAEPTHMYDPRHSIFFAWKEICRHWSILARVSRANHTMGVPYLTFSAGLEMFRLERQISSKLTRMPE